MNKNPPKQSLFNAYTSYLLAAVAMYSSTQLTLISVDYNYNSIYFMVNFAFSIVGIGLVITALTRFTLAPQKLSTKSLFTVTKVFALICISTQTLLDAISIYSIVGEAKLGVLALTIVCRIGLGLIVGHKLFNLQGSQ